MARGMPEVDKKVETAVLLDFYGALLTDTQREMMRLSFDEDYSLAEIAKLQNVSRQSVYDTLERAGAALAKYEEKLCLCARFQKSRDDIAACADALKMVRATDDTNQYLTDALRALDALESAEE